MKKSLKLNDLPPNVRFREEALEDMKALDNSQKAIVIRAIIKVAEKPQAKNEGGYGEPLGHHASADLTNCLKIKLKKSGIRVVYQYRRTNNGMEIVVVGMRSDDEVYRMAAKRLSRK